jgi:hypothetical protein
MPKGLDVDEVSIVSGSMSCNFGLRAEIRFSSSLSRYRVPTSSDQAYLPYTVRSAESINNTPATPT